MKANQNIVPELLDNEQRFTDPFFKQFKLRHRHQPLQLTDAIAKDYRFPTFYGNVTCAIGVFMCNYDKAQAMLPHPQMKPVRMPRNRALVTFSCYEYKDVMNVAPYNEIAMTIPVMVDPLVNVPVLPMIVEGFRKFGYYVFHMPVTSLENRIRGNKIWGLPKVLDDIDIQVENHVSTTTATDSEGNRYFTLEIPTEGTRTHFNVRSNLYSRLGDQLLQSQTCFEADFNVTKFMNRLWKTGGECSRPYLTIGQGPYGDRLRALEIDPQPFQLRYAHQMNACFDLPNADFRSPIRFADGA